MAKIKDVKQKILDAIYDIDTSKLSIVDLKTIAETVSIVSAINDEPFDFVKEFSKIYESGFALKGTTLSDLKEGE